MAAIAAILSMGLMALSGCSTASSSSVAKDKILVVASVNTWGALARQIGGKFVSVKSLITDPRQDPHSYQATVRDQLAVNQAGLLLANGSGYDPYLDTLAKAGHKTVLHIATQIKTPIANHNPHIWYSIAADVEVARLIEARFAALDPAHAKYFKNQMTHIVNRFGTLLKFESQIRNAKIRQTAVVTEGIANLMLRDCGIANLTPPAFSLAVQNETEIPPKALAAAKALVSGGRVHLLITNLQSQSPEQSALISAAKSVKNSKGQQMSRVVTMSEILPPKTSFYAWMSNNVSNLIWWDSTAKVVAG